MANLEDIAYPEICVDPPTERSNWRWTWGVYQPDAAWATIENGYAGSCEDAWKYATGALNRELQRRGYSLDI